MLICWLLGISVQTQSGMIGPAWRCQGMGETGRGESAFFPQKQLGEKAQVAIAATTFATPVFADFFIVREGASGPCRVVDTRPTDVRTIVIGNKAYTARADAERDIATVCPTARAVEGPAVAPSATVVVPPTVAAPLVAPPGAQAPLVAARPSQSRFLRPRAFIRVGPTQAAQQIQWAKPAMGFLRYSPAVAARAARCSTHRITWRWHLAQRVPFHRAAKFDARCSANQERRCSDDCAGTTQRLMAMGAGHETKTTREAFESEAVSHHWWQEDVRQH
jgi:hypothetical protein